MDHFNIFFKNDPHCHVIQVNLLKCLEMKIIIKKKKFDVYKLEPMKPSYFSMKPIIIPLQAILKLMF